MGQSAALCSVYAAGKPTGLLLHVHMSMRGAHVRCFPFLQFVLQIGDMSKLGICEAFKVKQAILLSSTEAAEMILRVDDIITCAPRRREEHM